MVLTDTFHKPGFKMHARILMHLLLCAKDPNVIREPLWEPSAGSFGSNIEYVAKYTADLLSTSFPNMARAQVRVRRVWRVCIRCVCVRSMCQNYWQTCYSPAFPMCSWRRPIFKNTVLTPAQCVNTCTLC